MSQFNTYLMYVIQFVYSRMIHHVFTTFQSEVKIITYVNQNIYLHPVDDEVNIRAGILKINFKDTQVTYISIPPRFISKKQHR